MGFYTGRTGHIKIAGKKVAKIRDWSLETTVELISTNTIETHTSTFMPGVKGATGSATMMYYRLESGESANYNQFTDILLKIMQKGRINTDDRVTLELNIGGNNKDDIKFMAYITSATVSVSTGELSVIPFNFTMDGDFIDIVKA